MIEQFISELFEKIGHTWTIDGEQSIPSERDVREVLDAAAARLYDRDVDDRLETAGIIIDKRPVGHDVYVYIGNYS